MKSTFILFLFPLFATVLCSPLILNRDFVGLFGQPHDVVVADTNPSPFTVPETTSLRKHAGHILETSVLSKQTLLQLSSSVSSLSSSSTTITAITTSTVSPTPVNQPPSTTEHTLLFTPSPILERPYTSPPDDEATEWKVVGITVICIVFVVFLVLGSMFFDTCCKFLRDVFKVGGNKSSSGGQENFVPDWEKRSWEVLEKDTEKDGRYPSFGSLDSIHKASGEKEKSVAPGPMPLPLFYAFANPPTIQPSFAGTALARSLSKQHN